MGGLPHAIFPIVLEAVIERMSVDHPNHMSSWGGGGRNLSKCAGWLVTSGCTHWLEFVETTCFTSVHSHSGKVFLLDKSGTVVPLLTMRGVGGSEVADWKLIFHFFVFSWVGGLKKKYPLIPVSQGTHHGSAHCASSVGGYRQPSPMNKASWGGGHQSIADGTSEARDRG